MANILPMEKQVAVISALAEGSGIRQTERMTGVHRETIMSLACASERVALPCWISKMRDLPCRQLQFDEIWGFIGKKERHVRPEDDPTMGDVWTFCAIDPDTKLVPAFKVRQARSRYRQCFCCRCGVTNDKPRSDFQRCSSVLRGRHRSLSEAKLISRKSSRPTLRRFHHCQSVNSAPPKL